MGHNKTSPNTLFVPNLSSFMSRFANFKSQRTYKYSKILDNNVKSIRHKNYLFKNFKRHMKIHEQRKIVCHSKFEHYSYMLGQRKYYINIYAFTFFFLGMILLCFCYFYPLITLVYMENRCMTLLACLWNFLFICC